MIYKEIAVFLFPLVLAGILHHFIVIKYNLFSFLAYPVDFKATWKDRRVFGKKKTLRGFIVMGLCTGIFLWVINSVMHIPLFYSDFISGIILGFGYSLFELPNSFIKRRIGLPESHSRQDGIGKLFFLIDHSDSVIGAVVSLFFIYEPSLRLIISLIILGVALHVLFDNLLYRYSYKKELIKV